MEVEAERLLTASGSLARAVVQVDRCGAAVAQQVAQEPRAEAFGLLGGTADPPARIVAKLEAVLRLEPQEDLAPLLRLLDEDAFVVADDLLEPWHAESLLAPCRTTERGCSAPRGDRRGGLFVSRRGGRAA
jgi:hypothetical protein